ncbi:hypothetical protein QTN25_005036 [Entamoeba marina]
MLFDNQSFIQMLSEIAHNHFKKLDSYSLLIVSKYFQQDSDYLNVICVCKKFKKDYEELFPKIQTQHLYGNEHKILDKQIIKYELWCPISFSECLTINERNVISHNICYTRKDGCIYGDDCIPEGITEIGQEFYSLKRIKSIIIPTTVNKLGMSCCFQCTYLTHISISPSIQSIPKSCFHSCSRLKLIDLPNCITSLGDSCFFGCESLTSINIPYGVQSIPFSCFQYCYRLKTVHLPDSLTSLNEFSFFKCRSLTNINIPYLISSIPHGCFKCCTRLRSIHLPTVVTSLEIECFESCKSLTFINIPQSIKTIPNSCFSNCPQLKCFDSFKSVTSYGRNYFEVYDNVITA